MADFFTRYRDPTPSGGPRCKHLRLVLTLRGDGSMVRGAIVNGNIIDEKAIYLELKDFELIQPMVMYFLSLSCPLL